MCATSLGTVFCCPVLKGLIGDIRFFIGLVGDCAQDYEGDPVDKCGVRDRCALHFRAERVEGVRNAVFLFRGADELVAADDTPLIDADVREQLLWQARTAAARSRDPQGNFSSVRRSHLGDDTGFVAKDGDIHIVIHGVFRDDNVADVDIVVK